MRIARLLDPDLSDDPWAGRSAIVGGLRASVRSPANSRTPSASPPARSIGRSSIVDEPFRISSCPVCPSCSRQLRSDGFSGLRIATTAKLFALHRYVGEFPGRLNLRRLGTIGMMSAIAEGWIGQTLTCRELVGWNCRSAESGQDPIGIHLLGIFGRFRLHRPIAELIIAHNTVRSSHLHALRTSVTVREQSMDRSELSVEMALYEKRRAEFERDHKMEWVVIHGDQVVGIFADFQDAARTAVEKYSRGPYLIEEIGSPPLPMPASLLHNPIYAES